MNIILLSGGSGTRLWPLSNEIRSKQFIKLFKHNGDFESMLQRMYRQINKVDKDAKIVIATSKTQVSAINNQLGVDMNVSIEPCRKDTFPAIVLSSLYLKDVMNVDENETIVVCPVDPYVDEAYFRCLYKMSKETDKANLTLMGIEPTYPSEKYGYIIPESDEPISRVSSFKEKPSEELATKYIQQGALWNGGVFAFKLKYLINKAHEIIEFNDYYDLFNKYSSLNKISFDYAVVEKEKSINVVRFGGQWKDIGTWNTLTESIETNVVGNGLLSKTENVHLINELNIPIIACGLRDVVISASPDGILVSDKEESSYIKPLVDSISQQIMYAEKSWGSYKVINVEEESITIKITLRAGCSMNYHSHKFRDEVWVVISGTGKTIIDGIEEDVKVGDVITMEAGCKHTIVAYEDLMLIEVQLGKEISVNDKQKYSL